MSHSRLFQYIFFRSTGTMVPPLVEKLGKFSNRVGTIVDREKKVLKQAAQH